MQNQIKELLQNSGGQMSEKAILEQILAKSKYTKKQVLGMLNGSTFFQKNDKMNLWSVVAEVEDIEQFLVKPKKDILGKRDRQTIVKHFENIVVENELKRIKPNKPLTEIIQEHGSAKVIGMLQAFTLLRPILRQKLMEKERQIINKFNE